MNKGAHVDKKRWLSSYRELVQEVEEETRLAGYWQEKASCLSAPQLSFTPSKSSNNKGMADYVIEFLDIAQYCSELANEANKKKIQILNTINQIEEPDYRQVLKMYYIGDKNFREIAESMHYSIDWIKRLHLKALEVIEIPKEYTQIH